MISFVCTGCHRKLSVKLGGLFKGRFNVLFADGHATSLPHNIHPVFLKRLITRAEGLSPGQGGIPEVEY